MKAIMISIQPQWVEKILNKEKTIEIRKTKPSCDLPVKVYIYCTKAKQPYQGKDCVRYDHLTKPNPYRIKKEYVLGANYDECLNGKVVAEFTLNKIEDFSKWEYDYGSLVRHLNLFAGTKGDYPFLNNYLKWQKKGYAWHIDNLEIYDKPKELSNFKHFKKYDWWDYGHHENKPVYELESLDRPPQSWFYIEELEV